MLECHRRNDSAAAAAVVSVPLASFDELSDILAIIIYGFLRPEELVMCVRCVCKRWKDVAREMIVSTELAVDNVGKYNVMRVMTTELPNLQQIKIEKLSWNGEHKWSGGEDPEDRVSFAAATTSHDIEIISNFSKLRELTFYFNTQLNGRYAVLFNFPLLQKLSIKYCKYLKFDLGMLAGLPVLKELECWENDRMTGNIKRLRVLKGTLEKVKIHVCSRVKGNFMDLADFPHLRELNLDDTRVRGDIRDIGETDFLALEQLILPRRVYGGKGYRLQRVSDAPDLARAFYLLKKQHPALKTREWHGRLSKNSPDWYRDHSRGKYLCIDGPPFYVWLVEAGSRIGYRWADKSGFLSSCEVNWLDPEPSRESSDYGEYIKRLQDVLHTHLLFKGFHEPPSEEECNRLLLEERKTVKAQVDSDRKKQRLYSQTAESEHAKLIGQILSNHKNLTAEEIVEQIKALPIGEEEERNE